MTVRVFPVDGGLCDAVVMQSSAAQRWRRPNTPPRSGIVSEAAAPAATVGGQVADRHPLGVQGVSWGINR